MLFQIRIYEVDKRWTVSGRRKVWNKAKRKDRVSFNLGRERTDLQLKERGETFSGRLWEKSFGIRLRGALKDMLMNLKAHGGFYVGGCCIADEAPWEARSETEICMQWDYWRVTEGSVSMVEWRKEHWAGGKPGLQWHHHKGLSRSPGAQN